jgi:hypothetical protein
VRRKTSCFRGRAVRSSHSRRCRDNADGAYGTYGTYGTGDNDRSRRRARGTSPAARPRSENQACLTTDLLRP